MPTKKPVSLADSISPAFTVAGAGGCVGAACVGTACATGALVAAAGAVATGAVALGAAVGAAQATSSTAPTRSPRRWAGADAIVGRGHADDIAYLLSRWRGIICCAPQIDPHEPRAG